MTTHSTRLPIIVAAAAAALLTFGASAVAQDDTPAETVAEEPTPEQRIKVLLSGYDYFPTKADLDGVADDVPTILISIYNEPDAKATTRGRVIDAMGYYDTETADEFLRYVLENRAALPSVHVHKALTSHAKAFREKSLDVVAPYLEVDDVQLRITASVAIGESAGLAGRAVLEKRLEVEPKDVVKKQIRRSLDDTL